MSFFQSTFDRAVSSANDTSESLMGFVMNTVDKAGSVRGFQRAEQNTPPPELGLFPSLSYRQKITLFVLFFATGVGCCILSTFFLPMILIKPHKFALTYTFGNLLMIGSTTILVGPTSQIKNIYQSSRATSFSLYIGSLLFTMYAALVWQNAPMVIVSLVVQFASLIWYAASYVPFAQRMITKCVQRALPV